MKTTCPGCSKHCSINHPRCKYGRQFFEKQMEKTCPRCPKLNNPEAPAKWEAFVEKNGAAWHLLSASRMAKKSLRKKAVTEKQLMRGLSQEECETLISLLGKLDYGNP